MKFDLDPVRVVIRRFIDQYVAARDQKKLCVALVEESGCVGQRPVLLDCRDAGGCKQQWFNQFSWPGAIEVLSLFN